MQLIDMYFSRLFIAFELNEFIDEIKKGPVCVFDINSTWCKIYQLFDNTKELN